MEDEADIRELMTLHLKREGISVIGVENGEGALELLETRLDRDPFDLVVLDWMLPGVSGLEICKKIQGRFPILMVTARADAADIVLGLEMGADDYVTKPFEIPVFVARVRALLRRVRNPAESGETVFRVGSLSLNTDSHDVFCQNVRIDLTASEFKVLAGLLKYRGKVLSRGKLKEIIEGEGVSVTDRVVDTHVFGLRKKLGSCADVIETIRGVGYRIMGV